ncbi:hypothetical protein M9H77_19667 [Catharanthus roseus]|uniref:Uncharacterized protein n=1 Tax=Catharanthus roseus TaxID=4058 RepID=A0ACC0BAX0_CATRO|nr:hypothetical protein M9H77_19667 [Catharanthus roseus]
MDLQVGSKPQILLFFIAIFITLNAHDSAAATYNLKNQTDRLVLLNIKLQISDDPLGVLKSWNNSHHHCHWEGVTCNVRHQRITNLTLRGHNFFGLISPHIGNLSFLKSLNLGEIDSTERFLRRLVACFRLRNLNLSSNILSGEIPVNLSQYSELKYVRIFNNKLGGKIPPDMQKNCFTPRILLKLASLKAIEKWELSQNKLTGEIPKDLQRLPYLNYLNLTYNNLEGEVPKNGVFGNLSQIILYRNFRLCGGIPELQLPSCPIHKKTKKNRKLLIFIISIVSSLFAMILISSRFLYFYKRSRHQKNDSSSTPSREDNFLRISYHELQRAMEGFSQENIIGTGNYRVICKGQLDQQGGKLVAIKVLNLKKTGVSKSFKAECNALKNIRHRNLVSLLTYSSSVDSKGNDFKVLIYSFMENSSLDMWLHPKTLNKSMLRNLNILPRLNIALDVVQHCNIFTIIADFNILLNSDLTAHVGDFGLAKLLPKTSIASSGNGTSSSITVKGTIGYAAQGNHIYTHTA